MAASLTIVDILSTPIATIKAALTAKSLITAVSYENATYLIFTTSLTSKVVKIYVSTTANFTVSYGDAYTSGTTITNEVIFCQRNSGTLSNLYLIADTTFFFFAREGSDSNYFGYLGALSNGDVLAFGLTNAGNSTYAANCKALNVTDGGYLNPVGLYGYDIFKDSSGYLMKMPLLWFSPTTKTLEMDGASPATTVGVSVTSWKGTTALVTSLGSNYYLSSAPGYMNDSLGKQVLATGLLVEFTP